MLPAPSCPGGAAQLVGRTLSCLPAFRAPGRERYLRAGRSACPCVLATAGTRRWCTPERKPSNLRIRTAFTTLNAPILASSPAAARCRAARRPRRGPCRQQQGHLGPGTATRRQLCLPALPRPGRSFSSAGAQLGGRRPSAAGQSQGPVRSRVPLASGARRGGGRSQGVWDRARSHGRQFPSVGQRWPWSGLGAQEGGLCRFSDRRFPPLRLGRPLDDLGRDQSLGGLQALASARALRAASVREAARRRVQGAQTSESEKRGHRRDDLQLRGGLPG